MFNPLHLAKHLGEEALSELKSAFHSAESETEKLRDYLEAECAKIEQKCVDEIREGFIKLEQSGKVVENVFLSKTSGSSGSFQGPEGNSNHLAQASMEIVPTEKRAPAEATREDFSQALHDAKVVHVPLPAGICGEYVKAIQEQTEEEKTSV